MHRAMRRFRQHPARAGPTHLDLVLHHAQRQGLHDVKVAGEGHHPRVPTGQPLVLAKLSDVRRAGGWWGVVRGPESCLSGQGGEGVPRCAHVPAPQPPHSVLACQGFPGQESTLNSIPPPSLAPPPSRR